jgi:predicted deacylase
MVEPLKIGTVSVMPGEAKRGGIPIGSDMYGRERELPIIVYRGLEDGPKLWISGATHGDEPEGPYSIMLTLPQVDPKQMKGTLVAVPVMNIEAFMRGDRGDPRDTFTYDMNRIYPGNPDGYATDRVAWAHWAAAKDNCDLHIAIHSGGDHSFLDTTIFAAETPQCLELAGAMGPDWDLVNTSGTGRGSPASMLAQEGHGAITVELGGWCKMLTTDFHEVGRRLSDAYLNVMRHYGMIPGQAQYPEKWNRGHQIALLANEDGLWVGEDVRLRVPMEKGTVLGRIHNLYGDEIEVVRAPEDGMVFGLRFRPMVLTGDWLCFYAVIDEVRDNLVPRSDQA